LAASINVNAATTLAAKYARNTGHTQSSAPGWLANLNVTIHHAIAPATSPANAARFRLKSEIPSACWQVAQTKS